MSLSTLDANKVTNSKPQETYSQSPYTDSGFQWVDSNTVLILRGGIPRPIGSFPKSLSQAILAGIILVGRLGVRQASKTSRCLSCVLARS